MSKLGKSPDAWEVRVLPPGRKESCAGKQAGKVETEPRECMKTEERKEGIFDFVGRESWRNIREGGHAQLV